MFHKMINMGHDSNMVCGSTNDGGLFRGSMVLALFSLIGLGLLYPLVGVGLGQMLFPSQANGSLIYRGAKPVGSVLVAQPFTGTSYFHPRPSAAAYNPMALAASNQALTNPDLSKRIGEAKAAIAQQNHLSEANIPSDLVTQSGSGIDPHITPEAAFIQSERVAQARGLNVSEVNALINQYTEKKQLGILGQPRVNVLVLNLALDSLSSKPTQIQKPN